jgi:ferritin-like metal-binding protein YciE
MESKSSKGNKSSGSQKSGSSTSGTAKKTTQTTNGNGTNSSSENGKSGNQKKKGGIMHSLFGTSADGKTLKEVFIEELKDIYNAEQQLIEALPEMADGAFNEELQDAFLTHHEQTERHARRIEKICKRLNIDLDDSEKCEAMEGLIEEGQQIIKDFEEGPVRDAALIIGAQKVEHYEIAAYGSLRTLAEVMGMEQIADLLDKTLEEEEFTDQLLNEIAEEINEEALYYGESDEIDSEEEEQEAAY